MSAYHKEWARKARAALMAELGGRCVWCNDTEELTFDCIMPRGDGHHRGSTDQRMCFYRKEHREHRNVQVLCHRCNSRKADSVTNWVPAMDWEHMGEIQPF